MRYCKLGVGWVGGWVGVGCLFALSSPVSFIHPSIHPSIHSCTHPPTPSNNKGNDMGQGVISLKEVVSREGGRVGKPQPVTMKVKKVLPPTHPPTLDLPQGSGPHPSPSSTHTSLLLFPPIYAYNN